MREIRNGIRLEENEVHFFGEVLRRLRRAARQLSREIGRTVTTQEAADMYVAQMQRSAAGDTDLYQAFDRLLRRIVS